MALGFSCSSGVPTVLTSKPRSNRPLTQFVCKACEEFLTVDPSQVTPSDDIITFMRKSDHQGNTSYIISIDHNQPFDCFMVSLYDKPILVVYRSREVDPLYQSHVRVGFTDFYDNYGQPSSTTAERLNGLLDCLGRSHFIPDGVRVFRDKEYHTTYIGMGDDKVAVGQGLAESICIKSNPSRLVFDGYSSFFHE